MAAILTIDGFDSCLMGIVENAGSAPVAVYDYNKCVEHLMDDGMSYEDAVEYMEFNVTSAYMGEGTPSFFYPMDRESVDKYADARGQEVKRAKSKWYDGGEV